MISPGEDDDKPESVPKWVESLVDEEEAGEIEETVQRWARMNGVEVGERYSKIPPALTASFSVLEGADA
jgi:hypothetical protein